MALTIGIVGLPNAGKSTLFNALTRNDVLAANYPFATIDPNIGVVGVPDSRLAILAGIFESAKILPATVQFVDIAGIVRGASEGEGMGNAFLSHIRESDAICQVTRVFRERGRHPRRRQGVAGRRHRDHLHQSTSWRTCRPSRTPSRGWRRRPGATSRWPHSSPRRRRLRRCSRPAPASSQSGLDAGPLRDLHLMTAKRQLFVFNCDTDELADEDLKARMREIVAPAEAIFLDAKSEAELAELGDDEESDQIRAEMLADMGVEELGVDALARHRARPTRWAWRPSFSRAPRSRARLDDPQGRRGPRGGRGVIHTDFQKGFIKAEIVSFDDLVAAGSMNAAKAAGKVRMEGKDYVMSDGDVVEFRFNV